MIQSYEFTFILSGVCLRLTDNTKARNPDIQGDAFSSTLRGLAPAFRRGRPPPIARYWPLCSSASANRLRGIVTGKTSVFGAVSGVRMPLPIHLVYPLCYRAYSSERILSICEHQNQNKPREVRTEGKRFIDFEAPSTSIANFHLLIESSQGDY